MHHEIHRHRVHDDLVEFDAVVFVGDRASDVEEKSLRELQDVRLVDERDFLAAVLYGVVERVANDALRADAGNQGD